jgi:hypothetical protein
MKRGILAVALLAVSGLANAGLSFNQLSTANRTEAFNVATLPFYAVGTSVGLGALQTNEKGTITFTYIGQESGFNNKFYLTIGATQMLTENPIGTQASAFVDTIGAISYKFEGNTGKFAINGGAWATGTSSGAGAGTYQYVIGYNDSAGASTLGDWDDYVVGVNFTPAIPEPEIYAMMGLGLGLIGWVGRRRKQLAA